MEVNKNKTKIIVFRKGAFLTKHEKWFIMTADWKLLINTTG